MEFFDKLGQKASEAYKVTADKTGKLAKEAKLRMKIGELKSQINDIYKEIGKKVYEKHIRKEEMCLKDILEEDCTKIDVISAEIETKLKECLELKDKKKCQQCFKEIDKDMNFCPDCGAKQEKEPSKEVEILEKLDQVDIKTENNKEDKTNLEKTVEVESDVNLKDNESNEEIDNKDE